MNRSEIGRAIGSDAVEERRQVASRFWNEWQSRLSGLPDEMRRELDATLQRLLEQAFGNAIITHVPGFKAVKFDPSVVGLDLPVPSIVNQMDPGTGTYVAVWWKFGPAPTDWTGFGGGGGGGVTTELGFKTAAAVNFRTEDFRALYSEGAPPHYYTIGGKVFQVQNQVQYAPTGGLPYLTGPQTNERSGSLKWIDASWSQYPIVQASLANLGVPDLAKLAEVWVFVEFVPPAGDSAEYQKLFFGLSDAPDAYGRSDLLYKMTKTSVDGGRVNSVTAAFLDRDTAPVLSVPSRVDTHTVMAMRLLPHCVEVYSGIPSVLGGDAYLCESPFSSLRNQMERLGALVPTGSDLTASASAAWAAGTSPTVFLTSDANRNSQDGPMFRAIRVDYLEAGLIGAATDSATGAAFEAVTSVDGLVALSTTKRSVKLSGTEDLIGLSTAGIPEGAEETVYFVEARSVLHDASVTTAEYAPLALEGSVDFTVGAKTLLKFKLINDGGLVWRHIGGSRT